MVPSSFFGLAVVVSLWKVALIVLGFAVPLFVNARLLLEREEKRLAFDVGARVCCSFFTCLGLRFDVVQFGSVVPFPSAVWWFGLR